MIKKILFVVAIGIGIWLIISLSSSLPRLFTASKRIDDAKNTVVKLEEENGKLESELEFRKSSEFVESQAREKLGFAKEGETVIILPKSKENNQEQKKSEEDISNWQKWKEILF